MAKDAFGHGSNSMGNANRTDFGHGKVGFAPGARFNGPERRAAPRTTNDHVADLRNRMANAQGPGHVATLMQGIKNALGYST